MPTFAIATNLKREQIPDNFISEASKLIASELGKPESYVLIQVNPDQLMSFGGTEEPCANISLSSIGVVGPDKNKKLAPKLSKFIEQNLGIKQDRFYIDTPKSCLFPRFYINIFDTPRSACVWNGNTFG